MKHPDTQPQEYVISIGSNSHGKHDNVARAVEWLSGMMSVFRASDIYETLPVSGIGDTYCNAVTVGICSLTYEELTSRVKHYETENGRTQESRSMGIVPIDLDIVMVGDEVIRESDFNRSFFKVGYEQINAISASNS